MGKNVAGESKAYVPAVEAEEGAGFVEVEGLQYDVAKAYALLSGGTVPPVIRGEELEG